MKDKSGYLIILLILTITFLIWISVAPLHIRFTDYSSSTKSLGQITALLGTVLFAFNLFLTTRLNIIEDMFGGLDKVYRAHHILGMTSFLLLISHPILLALKYLPGNLDIFLSYFIPGNYWPVNYGIFALYFMILLLILTLFIKLKYQYWKFSHKLLGLVFIIATFHIFLISSEISSNLILKYWMIFICSIGLSSHIYGSYFIVGKYVYVIDKIKRINNCTIVEMSSKNKKIEFKPGQFVYLRFKKDGYYEKHPFTIANSENDKLRFVIKDLGDYTSKIKDLEVETIAEIFGPHGRFIYSNYNKDQIWIAGGIGITPFLSFANDLKKSKFNYNIDLFYCVKNENEFILLEELKSLETDKFKIHNHCSNSSGNINLDLIEKQINIKNKEILICGPSVMMYNLKSQFNKKGIKNIHFEDFNYK